MTLGSTQRLIEMRDKGGQCVGLTTLPPSCVDFLEIWATQPPENLRGLSRPVIELLYLLSKNMENRCTTNNIMKSEI